MRWQPVVGRATCNLKCKSSGAQCCRRCAFTRLELSPHPHAGLEVRDAAGAVVDNQVVKVFKARKTGESAREAAAHLRPLLPVTVPVA